MKQNYNVIKLNFISKLFKRYFAWVILLVTCLILTGSFRSLGAAYVKDITDHIQTKGIEGLGKVILITCLIQFVNYSTKFVAASSCMFLSQKLSLSIRTALIDHLQRIPYSEYEKYKTGEMQSIIHNDAERAGEYIYIVFSRLGTSFVTSIFTFLIMAYIDLKTTVLVLAITVGLGLVNQRILRNIKKNEKTVRKSTADITNTVINGCETADVIKAYRAQSYMINLFKRQRHGYNTATLNVRVIDGYRIGLSTIVNNFTLFGSAIYLAYRAQSTGTLGDVLAYITLLTQALISIDMIFRWMSRIIGSNTAWERVAMILEKDQEENSEIEGINVPEADSLEFENLSYSYDGEKYMFSNYDITLQKGKVYGITGESGSGKSTLLKCIMGIYKSEKTQIYLNGEELSPSGLRSLFAYVPSENYMFAGTIYENLSLGDKNVTVEKCLEAAINLGIEKWIESLPQGVHTLVSEGGQNFSGGQRQMLCILRALVSSRPVIVLDEPFSALDKEHSKNLLSLLENIKKDKIILFTSHRENSMGYCDFVYSI